MKAAVRRTEPEPATKAILPELLAKASRIVVPAPLTLMTPRRLPEIMPGCPINAWSEVPSTRRFVDSCGTLFWESTSIHPLIRPLAKPTSSSSIRTTR